MATNTFASFPWCSLVIEGNFAAYVAAQRSQGIGAKSNSYQSNKARLMNVDIPKPMCLLSIGEIWDMSQAGS